MHLPWNGESEERLITKIGTAAGRDNPGSNHELWLEMQGAYNRYKNASAALDALTAMSLDTVVTSERDSRIEAAGSVQRTAFENYIETRLQLSECLLSKNNAEPMESEVSERARGIRISARVIVAALAALLFPTAFGLGYLVHEHRQSPGLQAASDESNLTLNQTRKQLQALADQVEALKATNQGRARPTRAAPIKSGRPGQTSARSLAKGGRRGRSHQKVVIQAQRHRERHYLVTPQKHSERSGPIPG